MAITDVFFPQGNYLDIKANAPTRRDYNINVTADLVNNLPPELSVYYPAAAAAISLPYDGIQALTRTTDKDFNQAITMGGLTSKEIAADALGTAFAREAPFTSLRDRTIGASKTLAEQLANINLTKTVQNPTNFSFTDYLQGKYDINQGLDSFNNLVSNTVMAEPQKGFEDYPGSENLGGTQNFDLEGVQNIISQMEEEKGNYIERPEDRFSMDGILQSLGGFAKDTAGRYIGSQALSGAGGMLFGPYGALIGGIIGGLKGGDLFNQNTYSQQMYNNLTSQGQGYVDRLYGPGGVLQGYNQFSAFGKGALGTIANNLAKYPNMSPARRNVYLEAANKYINSIDQSKQGIDAVTKPGTYSYDDSIINYAPPSGGDSGGSSGGETYGNVGSYEDFGSTY